MESQTPKRLRLLALDLDDTLLRSDLTISYRTRNAIKRTESEGVIIALASGRIPEAMIHSSQLLGLDKRLSYLVSNNGSIIQESHTDKIIHEARIDVETALAVCDLARAEGFDMQIYEDDIMYVTKQNVYSNYDQKMTGIRQVVVANFRAMVAEGCHKLIVPGEPAHLAHVEQILKNFLGGKATIVTSRPYFLEIMPKDTNKGSALAMIANLNGISAEETLAIGDSMNDEAMIRWAGIGVAMANGDERIKNIAKIITNRSNDDDGVAEVIEKYFLEKDIQNV